jgi:hypothetical protein
MGDAGCLPGLSAALWKAPQAINRHFKRLRKGISDLRAINLGATLSWRATKTVKGARGRWPSHLPFLP